MQRPGRVHLLPLLALLAAGSCGQPQTRPNLLLITIDTLRADRLACYGGPSDVGTAVCALARGGTRFLWAFSTAPYTAPAVASILTSRYPIEHRVTQNARSILDSRETSLAELLESAGYQTAAFVSNPVLDRGRNLAQGFQVYDQRMTRRERNRPGFAEREAEATTDAAVAWAQVAAREPWFLWVHFQDPHGPYEPPDAAPERDRPGEARLPVLDDESGIGGIPRYQALPGLASPGAYERRYLAEIRYLDSHVQRLLDRLDALGSPPAVLLASDHGEAFGEDGVYLAHGHSVALDQIRVPLLWRPPPAGRRGSPAEKLVSSPVSLVDVAPTLLQAAGLEVPPSFQGRPLPGTGLAAAEDPGRPVFAEHTLHAAVIAGDSYYARARRTLPEDQTEIAGEPILRLPRRAAHLPAAPELPGYAVAEPGSEDPLEPILAAFLAAEPGRPGATRDEVPEQTRRRLHALGYAD